MSKQALILSYVRDFYFEKLKFTRKQEQLIGGVVAV